jgi:hypothetical protein
MSASALQAVSPPPAALSPAVSLDRGSFRPHPLEIDDFGRKPGQVTAPSGGNADGHRPSQITCTAEVVIESRGGTIIEPGQEAAEVFDQPAPADGRQAVPMPATVRAGLALIDEARPPRNVGGRPKVIDDVAKVKIATLMATGASLRQVAGFLGVSHSTVSAAIAADPALKQEIDAARQRAVLHPPACIVRESGRNWKAAVWLMDYLNKQAASELPADERNREEAESKAAVLIQNDLAGELRQQAKNARLAQERREDDEQWRQEIAARKARKLARIQRQQQPARGAAPPTPSQAAAPP